MKTDNLNLDSFHALNKIDTIFYAPKRVLAECGHIDRANWYFIIIKEHNNVNEYSSMLHFKKGIQFIEALRVAFKEVITYGNNDIEIDVRIKYDGEYHHIDYRKFGLLEYKLCKHDLTFNTKLDELRRLIVNCLVHREEEESNA